MSAAREILLPADPAAASQIADFTGRVAERTGLTLDTPLALHRFSVEHWREFWELFLTWSRLPISGEATPVCEQDAVEQACFFPNVRVNFAEALLDGGGAPPDALAVIALDESGRRMEITRADLRRRVERTARGLAARGVRAGDHVIAVVRNDLETIVAALAATGLGAVWSSVAPDLGPEAILARFAPLKPRWLFAHARADYQGRPLPVAAVLERLRAEVTTLAGVFDLDGDGALAGIFPEAVPLRSLETDGHTGWERFPFNHPLFVMFSSGTTGAPKCIVHGVGGTLLEHAKEHRLHGDLRQGERLFFHTSCGWMMWNWLLSGLLAGATVVVRDGSPTHPEPTALWKMVQDERITVFGANPAYLGFCRDLGQTPGAEFDLSSLRAAMSTGSILFDGLFDWFLEKVARVPLQSISGGTDIIGCFVLGHPQRPLVRGESQMLSLGLDVRAVDPESGRELPAGQTGELICARPFPSRPVGFLGVDGAEKFHAAYFSQHAGVWTHGDFVAIYPDGGARILGRSDGVLNVRGIRIGPAEIYAVLQEFGQIAQAMAVEQAAPDQPGGAQIVLLVVMQPGAALDRPLTLAIKKALKTKASAQHVPGLIVDVPALPVTFSGKLSEKAAREAVNGREIPNRGALRNPDCLDQIRERVRQG